MGRFEEVKPAAACTFCSLISVLESLLCENDIMPERDETSRKNNVRLIVQNLLTCENLQFNNIYLNTKLKVISFGEKIFYDMLYALIMAFIR